MNPETIFCHNAQCPARGQAGAGNMGVWSRKEPCYRCRCAGLTLWHVQAGGLRGKAVGGRVWQAAAIMVSARLWVGGVVWRHRDGGRILARRQQGRAWCGSILQALLLCGDGLARYGKAFQKIRRYAGVRCIRGRGADRSLLERRCWCANAGDGPLRAPWRRRRHDYGLMRRYHMTIPSK